MPIPTKLDQLLVTHLDKLVSDGLYVSRSEAIRDGVRRIVGERYLSLNGFRKTIARTATALLAERMGSRLTDIILFGSTATGTSTLESDVDLLLLSRSSPTPQLRHCAHEAVYSISLYSGQTISLILLSRGAFVSSIKTGSRFAFEIMRDGIQLHGRLLEDVRRK